MSQNYNLATEPWLPVRLADGAIAWRAPPDVLGDHGDNPPVAFAWGRADFDVAARELMIGLAALAFQPRTPRAWLERWNEPPAPADIAERLAPFAAAFDLDGPGPRFCQDRSELDGDERPIDSLLIEWAGGADIFINGPQRGGGSAYGRPAAAMALYALQAFAPAGGRGHRTSMRGGGPLTTLVVPPGRPSLWQLTWLNVPEGLADPIDDPAAVCPWLAPTRTSEGGRGTTPEDAHPLQMFFGMPRRIRLTVAPAPDGSVCDLTGRGDAMLVTGLRTLANGVNYTGAWRHPLTPHYRPKANAIELLPEHVQPGGLRYRHWVGWVTATDTKVPAAIVATARQRFRDLDLGSGTRLLAGGYDVDNMKARGFAETEMPLFILADDARTAALDELAKALVASADIAARQVPFAVKRALFDRPADVKGDFSPLAERFWDDTAPAFWDILAVAERRLAVAADPWTAVREQDGYTPRRDWLATVRETGLAIFDGHVEVGMADVAAARRMIDARKSLVAFFAGKTKDGAAVFNALDLAVSPPAKLFPKTQKRNTAHVPA